MLNNNSHKEESKQQQLAEQKKFNQKNFNTISKELNREIKFKNKNNDTQEKSKLIYQILKYIDSPRFGTYIKKTLKISPNYNSLLKKSIKNLNETLDRIRINLDNRNLDGFYQSMLVNATLSFETMMENFYSIEGFSDSLMNNPHFLDSVERYKIENIGKMPSIPPSLQMIFIMSQTAMICHSVSKKKSHTQSTQTMEPPQLTTQQQKDLDIIDDEKSEMGDDPIGSVL